MLKVYVNYQEEGANMPAILLREGGKLWFELNI